MDRTAELLARFEAEYLQTNSISPKRRNEQLRFLRRLAGLLEHPLDELSAQDVRTFMGGELERGLHPNTVRYQLGMVRSFVTWASQAHLIDPLRTAELKSVANPRGSSSKSTPRPYKASEIRDFYAALDDKYPVLPITGKGSRALRRHLDGHRPHLRRHLWRHARRLQFEAMIALALEQGLRKQEILNLSIPAVHYDNDQLVVLTAKQGPGSKVTRAIPYATHARSCVQQWLDFRWLLTPPHENPWLLLGFGRPIDEQLAPMTHRAMSHALYVFGEWEWHRFRHTCATEWLRSEVPLEKVSIYMGHSSLEQTRAYTEILNRDVDKAFGRAEADFAKRLGLAA